MRSSLQVVGYHRTAGYGGIAKTRLRREVSWLSCSSTVCFVSLFFFRCRAGWECRIVGTPQVKKQTVAVRRERYRIPFSGALSALVLKGALQAEVSKL